MTDSIFNAIIIPGEVRGSRQCISVGFELNLKHSVFGDSSVATKWKNDVLQFTAVVNAVIKSNAFTLKYLNNGNITLMPLTFHELKDPSGALELWAGMLGYTFESKAPSIRQKQFINGNEAAISQLYELNKKKWTVGGFEGYPVMNTSGVVIQGAQGPITSIQDITNQINSNPLLVGLANNKLQDEVVRGIGIAYNAVIKSEKNRNLGINEYAKAQINTSPHKGLQGIIAQYNSFADAHYKNGSDDDDQLKVLLQFYQSAQAVINERDYIQEAIDKLNMTLSIRKFIGTMIDGYITIPANTIGIPSNVTGLLRLMVDETKLAAELSNKGVTLNYIPYFSTALMTAVSSSTSDRFLPAPVGGNYNIYYKNTVPLLQGKTQVISWEPESINTNIDLASKSLNENENIATVTVDPQIFDSFNRITVPTFKDLENIQQATINKNLLINAAIKMNNHINNIQTKGHQLYIINPDWLNFNPNEPTIHPSGDSLREHDLISGYLVYVRKKGYNELHCLNLVKEYFGHYDSSPERLASSVPLSIGTDAMVHTLINAPSAPANADTNLNGIHNGFQFLWDGTTISSQNPLRHKELTYINEQHRIVDLINDFTTKIDEIALESLVLNLYSRRWITIKQFPFPTVSGPISKYLLARGFDMGPDALASVPLKFNKKPVYQYAMVGQFHNGYSPVSANDLLTNPDYENGFTDFYNFLRDDHIRSPIVALPFDIYEGKGHKQLRDSFLGESNVDLVVRNRNMAKHGYTECYRYILPPQVPSFQIYLWYDMQQTDDFTKSRRLNELELYKWYKKSQKENENGQSIAANGGNVIYKQSLDYLPDPAVTGFVIKFFYDSDLTLGIDNEYPETFCAYSTGVYPDLGAWKILLRDLGSGPSVHADQHSQELYIGIMPGRRVFAKIIPTFDHDFACLSNAFISSSDIGMSNSGASYHYDQLKSGATAMSFTYASQYPIIEPEITNIKISRFITGAQDKKPSTVQVSVMIKYEHLNLWKGITLPGEQPTGELDVYMLWDEYSLSHAGIQKSIAQKTNVKVEGENYIYVGKVDFNDDNNKGAAYHANLQVKPEAIGKEDATGTTGVISFELDPAFNISYFTKAVFRVRNVSKFPAYFQRVAFKDMGTPDKDKFSLWSRVFTLTDPLNTTADVIYDSAAQASAGYLFNNLKPSVPQIEKIVPLIVRDDYREKNGKSVFYQRVRIYFNQVPLTGRDARIGIIVAENASVYSKTLTKNISKAGKDMVTDQLSSKVNLVNDQLTAANFNLNRDLLEEQFVLNFSPGYDHNDKFPVGLVNYKCIYDQQQELWYIDSEISLTDQDGHELHNPFVQLFLVAYQPFSANYNAFGGAITDSLSGYSNDYRLSLPVEVEFFSIYPSRTFSNPLVLFKKHPHNWCTLSGQTSSLFVHESDKKLHTDFIVSVQRKAIHGIWETCNFEELTIRLSVDGKPAKTAPPNLTKYYASLFNNFQNFILAGKTFECDFQIKFSKGIFNSYRVVIQEVDCFNGLTLDSLGTILDHSPILMTISGVHIRGTYIFEEK